MESKSNEAPKAAEASERKSMMPVVAGVGVLAAIIAAIALWPRSDATDAGGKGKDKAAASSSDKGGKSGDGAGNEKAGGVAARAYDNPNAPGQSGKVNPAIRLPNLGMAPEGAGPPEPETPPTFANKAEEIAWYEARLARATQTLESRQKFADRLPATKDRVASGPDPQRQLEVFEGRKKIVEENLAKAQADVAEIERKLKELRGS
jgi:hypothetical protein